MKTFYNIEEMKPYYSDETNTYRFIEAGEKIDVGFSFNFFEDSNIVARDVIAVNIMALSIIARDISYYGICCAYHKIACTSIGGRRENAKHFVLDREINIISKETKTVTLELTDEQLAKIKAMLGEENEKN